MKKSILIIFSALLSSAVIGQIAPAISSTSTIDLSLEQRVEAIDRNAQQLNLRLSNFERQQHKGCAMLITGLLSSTLGTVLLINQDVAGTQPALIFGGLGAGLSAVGTIMILDAPRRLKVVE